MVSRIFVKVSRWESVISSANTLFSSYKFFVWSWKNNSVSCPVHGWNCISVLGRDKRHFSLLRIQTTSDAHPFYSYAGMGTLLRGQGGRESEAQHLPPSSNWGQECVELYLHSITS